MESNKARKVLWALDIKKIYIYIFFTLKIAEETAKAAQKGLTLGKFVPSPIRNNRTLLQREQLAPCYGDRQSPPHNWRPVFHLA